MRKSIISVLVALMLAFTVSCTGGSESTKEESALTSGEDLNARQTLFKIIENIENADSFYTVCSGETKSMGITQKISARRVVIGDSVFKHSVSYSRLVKTATQTFASCGKYLLRKSEKVKSLTETEWEDTATDIGRDEYLSRYGSVITGLNNYILTEQTVISVEEEEIEGGYLLKVTADAESSTVNIVKEMKTNASSNELPTFESVYMEITADENLQVQSVLYQGKYKVKIALLGEVDCEENMTETFYGINKTTTFAEEEFFSEYL